MRIALANTKLRSRLSFVMEVLPFPSYFSRACENSSSIFAGPSPRKKMPTRKQRARYVRNTFTGDCSQAVSRSRQECSRAKDTAQIVASSTRKERALRFILLIVSICSFPLRNQGGLRKLSSRSYSSRIPVTVIFFQEGIAW